MKITIKILFSILVFYLCWFFLATIPWIKLFKINQIKQSSEEKIGSFIWEATRNNEKEYKDTFMLKSIDSIIDKICVSNQISSSKIKLHMLQSEVENAFTLPDGHLVIYTSLVYACESETELAGVIAHEIAHIKLNHVMQKLSTEIGLGVLLGALSSNNPIILNEAVQLLSSTAYSRSLEDEADHNAIEFMMKSKINPMGLADFLTRLSNKNDNELSILSTHPNTSERVKSIKSQIRSYSKNRQFQRVLNQSTWDHCKSSQH
jgi:predicted Zn-dependent protease